MLLLRERLILLLFNNIFFLDFLFFWFFLFHFFGFFHAWLKFSFFSEFCLLLFDFFLLSYDVFYGLWWTDLCQICRFGLYHIIKAANILVNRIGDFRRFKLEDTLETMFINFYFFKQNIEGKHFDFMLFDGFVLIELLNEFFILLLIFLLMYLSDGFLDTMGKLLLQYNHNLLLQWFATISLAWFFLLRGEIGLHVTLGIL